MINLEPKVQELMNALPADFVMEGRVAVNDDPEFGGEVFFERHRRTWAYLPKHKLIKGGDSFSSPEEAFKAFADAVERYKELRHWKMTHSEWKEIHSDYKGIDSDGKKSAMRNINGACVIVPVTIID